MIAFNYRNRRSRGFSTLEVLLIILITGILAIVVSRTIVNARRNVVDSKWIAQMDNMIKTVVANGDVCRSLLEAVRVASLPGGPFANVYNVDFASKSVVPPFRASDNAGRLGTPLVGFPNLNGVRILNSTGIPLTFDQEKNDIVFVYRSNPTRHFVIEYRIAHKSIRLNSTAYADHLKAFSTKKFGEWLFTTGTCSDSKILADDPPPLPQGSPHPSGSSSPSPSPSASGSTSPSGSSGSPTPSPSFSPPPPGFFCGPFSPEEVQNFGAQYCANQGSGVELATFDTTECLSPENTWGLCGPILNLVTGKYDYLACPGSMMWPPKVYNCSGTWTVRCSNGATTSGGCMNYLRCPMSLASWLFFMKNLCAPDPTVPSNNLHGCETTNPTSTFNCLDTSGMGGAAYVNCPTDGTAVRTNDYSNCQSGSSGQCPNSMMSVSLNCHDVWRLKTCVISIPPRATFASARFFCSYICSGVRGFGGMKTFSLKDCEPSRSPSQPHSCLDVALNEYRNCSDANQNFSVPAMSDTPSCSTIECECQSGETPSHTCPP